MSLAIPALCIEALGGMQDSDPPVLVRGRDYLHSLHPTEPDEPGPMFNAADEGARLVLPASAPALLRVLARALGWNGEGQLLLRANSGRWDIEVVTAHGYLSPVLVAWLPRHISANITRLDALAEAVVWYARYARASEAARAAGAECKPASHSDVRYIEETNDLTPWEVQ